MKKYRWIIGIDPGVETGFSVYDADAGKLNTVSSHKIHTAMETILFLHNSATKDLFVRIEDARKRIWFGKSGRDHLQGAGSIKRDCKIWEDFLTDNNIPFEMVAPKNNKTKINADYFKKITGWQDHTNEHSRDAAMLVFGINNKFKIK